MSAAYNRLTTPATSEQPHLDALLTPNLKDVIHDRDDSARYDLLALDDLNRISDSAATLARRTVEAQVAFRLQAAPAARESMCPSR
jgi:hypothetical protein